MLEHRICADYLERERRKQKVQAFNDLVRRQEQPEHKEVLSQLLKNGIEVFKSSDIKVDRTKPVNTSGSFCDFYRGYHPKYGKVGLKRLREDMRVTSRLSVRVAGSLESDLTVPSPPY